MVRLPTSTDFIKNAYKMVGWLQLYKKRGLEFYGRGFPTILWARDSLRLVLPASPWPNGGPRPYIFVKTLITRKARRSFQTKCRVASASSGMSHKNICFAELSISPGKINSRGRARRKISLPLLGDAPLPAAGRSTGNPTPRRR